MKVAQVIPCLKCRRPTRPPRSLAGAYPGTVPRVGDNCKTCHEGREAIANPEPRMTVEEIRSGLAAFMARRRDRENAMYRREMAATYPHLIKESA